MDQLSGVASMLPATTTNNTTPRLQIVKMLLMNEDSFAPNANATEIRFFLKIEVTILQFYGVHLHANRRVAAKAKKSG